MSPLSYLRYLAYALFALGLINLRYQTGASDLFLKTVVISGTGVIIFALTYLNFGKALFAKSFGRTITWIIGIAAIIFAIIN
ncbi:MAG: hypothetical protein ABS00_01015 [Actinobacteria bacterium BACL2 MAG-120920-bin34]|jgi:hypothetical protein|nr:MAG: hypothetical protein ABS00_01015 [Actinobacteria bacterium BACL2 MAG-120920-bin34]